MPLLHCFPIGGAQEDSLRGGGVPCHMPDKREGLKAGLYDAGEAAWNMKLIATTREKPKNASDLELLGKTFAKMR